MIRICLLLLCSSLFGAHSIVFIHLGRSLPSYLPIAIQQARLFNKNCPIYLVANELALEFFSPQLLESRTICVSAESLLCQENHIVFRRLTRLDRVAREGFWMFATERFFYLFELMKLYGLSDVFHLEYDNLLYADVSSFLPIFHKSYLGKIAATFDNDDRCIAGLMYVSDPFPLERFLQFVSERVRLPKNDMEFLAAFKSIDEGAYIDHLPVIPPSYAAERALISPYHHTARHPELYSRFFDEFRSIFDAAALGQYLGGIDPRNGPSAPGFINESSVFNPSLFQYEWIEDDERRLVPMIVYQGERWPIVNLHIHSKNLMQFYSRRDVP